MNIAQTGVTGSLPKIPTPWTQIARTVLGIAAALIVLFLLRNNPEWAIVWIFGLAFGFVLQRARFCFASSFRDIFLLRDGRNMKGVLIGMAVATVGFAFAMYNVSPNIVAGRFPPDANILPLGFHTLFAGFIFAVGMILAGGCLSGSLYRMGEGYAASWVTMLGVLIGFLFLGYTWNFWWDLSYTHSVRIWFPEYVGWIGGVVITLVLIAISYLLLVWWESRGGAKTGGSWKEEEPPPSPTFSGQIGHTLRSVFVKGWPIAAAGAILGGLNTLFFFYIHPLGVTSGMYEWMNSIAGTLRIAPGELKGIADIGGACVVGETKDASFLSFGHMSMLNFGLVLGAFTAASIAGEFKLRFPKQKKRYIQSLGGGVLMGYGAGLALGCTLGAFFSAVPSLALNGWGFAVGLLVGAFVGVKLIRRIG